MDYKERCKELEFLIKNLYPTMSDYQKEKVEGIFPELRELDDERIRKWIINEIKIKHHNLDEDNVDFVDKAIAWLEKQNEQKSIIIIPQFKVGDIIKPKSYNEEHLIKGINENGYVLDVDIIIPFKDEDVWEIVEQKSAWSEEDEKIYQSIIDDTVQENQLDGNQITWIKFIKDRVQPQPKQEWSEEDKLVLKQAIYVCHQNGYTAVEDWLKSLKDRVQPQPTPEWSEYDNKMIKNIEDSLNVYSESHPCLKVVVSEELEWLKSLKERVQPQPKQEWSEEDELMLNSFLHKLEVCDLLSNKEITWIKNKLKSIKHWKPSKEQMEELEYVTRGNSYPHLSSLYQYLKNFES